MVRTRVRRQGRAWRQAAHFTEWVTAAAMASVYGADRKQAYETAASTVATDFGATRPPPPSLRSSTCIECRNAASSATQIHVAAMYS